MQPHGVSLFSVRRFAKSTPFIVKTYYERNDHEELGTHKGDLMQPHGVSLLVGRGFAKCTPRIVKPYYERNDHEDAHPFPPRNYHRRNLVGVAHRPLLHQELGTNKRRLMQTHGVSLFNRKGDIT